VFYVGVLPGCIGQYQLKERIIKEKKCSELWTNVTIRLKTNDYNVVLRCTNLEFYERIRAQLKPGMKWFNYETEWTLEYIIPLAHMYNHVLPLTIHTRNGPRPITMEDMYICVNVRPVWNHECSINKFRTPEHKEVIEKCIEIINYLDNEK